MSVIEFREISCSRFSIQALIKGGVVHIIIKLRGQHYPRNEHPINYFGKKSNAIRLRNSEILESLHKIYW
jgi:hypothetical protein